MWEESGYWRYDWDTSGSTKGNHVIKITAQDENGNSASLTRNVYCHPEMEVSEIGFLDGHNLWQRSNTPANDFQILPPQWQPGWINPVAYTIGSQMTIRPKIESSDVTGSVYVSYDVGATWKDSNNVAVGTYVVEKAMQTSGFPCYLNHYPTAPGRVMDYVLDQSYHLYVRKSLNSDWCPAGTTNATHSEIYLTFGDPIGPWGPSGTPRCCWSQVISEACEGIPEPGYTWSEKLDARKKLTEVAYWRCYKDYNGDESHYPDARFNMWTFWSVDDWADCRDMSAWWVKLCNSVGLNGQVQRIIGGFNTKDMDPIGDPSRFDPSWSGAWDDTSWNYHQVGHYSNVFDGCARLKPSAPRVPQNEPIDGTYKTDLYSSGTWSPQTPVNIQEVN